VLTVIVTIITTTGRFMCIANNYFDNKGRSMCSISSYCDNKLLTLHIDLPVIFTITVSTTHRHLVIIKINVSTACRPQSYFHNNC
jgi:hypothetical protein